MSDAPDPDATVSDSTRAAEHDDESVVAHADAPPTPDEEAVAEDHADLLTDDVRAHEEDMANLGANVPGEGKID